MSTWGILLVLLLMVVFRAVLMDVRVQPLAACKGCMALLTLQHDAAVLGAVLLALGLGCLAPGDIIRKALRVVVVLATVVYAMDVLVLSLYNMRLVVEDFIKYGLDVGGVASIAGQTLRTPEGWFALVGVAALVWGLVAFVRTKARLDGRRAALTVVAGVVLFAVGLIPTRRVFAHSWAYRSVFAVNLDRAILASYSDAFADSLEANHKDLRVGELCTLRPARSPDVVMVVLEGFSMYHSRFFSGLGDLTPNLDRIASNHTAFTRFWANGFTTENGLIALLGGEVPAQAPGQIIFGGGFAFDGFSDLPRSLPRQFNEHGYRTAFLTTGDLAFSGKGAWLGESGFSELIGHDDPFYDGWPRLHFGAAPDSALYLRALEWLDERPDDRPFFLVVETVSSHHPFIEPGTEKKSEEAVFRYADRQLGLFYDALREGALLDSLLLVVASDHRTMTPLLPEEMAMYGVEARALVPFVVADPLHPEAMRIEERYQQVDLSSSFDAMLTGRSCPTLVRGDLLGRPPIPPGCVLQMRGEDRGRVELACGDELAAVRLRGDRTRVESGALSIDLDVVNQINFERLERRVTRRPGRDR